MSNDFWQDHNFRLEPWGTDYEPPIAVGAVVVERSTCTATCSKLTIHRIIGFGGNQETPLTHTDEVK